MLIGFLSLLCYQHPSRPPRPRDRHSLHKG